MNVTWKAGDRLDVEILNFVLHRFKDEEVSGYAVLIDFWDKVPADHKGAANLVMYMGHYSSIERCKVACLQLFQAFSRCHSISSYVPVLDEKGDHVKEESFDIDDFCKESMGFGIETLVVGVRGMSEDDSDKSGGRSSDTKRSNVVQFPPSKTLH